ncbi:hypothetical protein DM860_010985 [Cuscuta australis]|uniref:Major facilitator superfamily (MFS) profile domain-containing protein n=1 Tax=Cuscuta australis TaxID=267555 RepID=A0A328E4W4_9ASTE|nr:hypothetical protein DM860_010985 [Cuscuta australis]
MTTSTLPPEGERRKESRASTAASREPDRETGVPLKLLVRVASIAGGIQFGLALQLSLLTPYVQELGIPHAWASMIWLCSPVCGLFVQPLVGLISDRCRSRFEKDHRRNRVANAYFSLFMAAGNILGCATGSFSGWYKMFPFILSDACAVNCANLKTAFLLDIVFIAIATYISLSAVKEQPLDSYCNEDSEQSSHHGQEEPFLWELFGTFKYFPGTIWVVLLVTTLTWIAWFPFTLYDTNWVGREIYGGEPNGTNYSNGV